MSVNYTGAARVAAIDQERAIIDECLDGLVDECKTLCLEFDANEVLLAMIEDFQTLDPAKVAMMAAAAVIRIAQLDRQRESEQAKVRSKSACAAYDGPETRWREIVVSLSWLDEEIDRPSLTWPIPMCGTSLCTNIEHLSWSTPKELNYPAGVCVYCGALSESMDHLLPRTWTGDAVRKNVLTVPACMECNAAINDRYAPSITERRALAQKSIKKRYARVLKMPNWSESEIAELGKTLRSTIRAGLHDKKLTQARLAWPDDPNYDMRAMQKSGVENPYAIGLLT